MHLFLMYIICRLSVAHADPIKLFGSATNLLALGTISSTDVTRQLYESCSAQSENNVTTTGSVCVALAVSHMLSALARVGRQEVLVVNNTQSTTQRRSVEQFLDEYNGPSSRSAMHSVNAVNLVPSEVHPYDGMSIRTNVESDSKFLHIHTNGSFAIAAFEPSPQSRRDTASDFNPVYHFSGVSGLKMEATWPSNCTDDVLDTDMQAFGYGWAYGSNGVNTVLQQSDSWIYSVCPQSGSEAIFQGRLIAEIYNPGQNYEAGPYPPCT